ncbi:Isoaspartyl peptidase/L-asparaginase [Acipenser ruthenus]|uniref:Isoaspartyl peptidase/L-asparaginase n=1 Tax=Acipenser ruthenus TaxID=7906 RepID=A0A444U5H3_ACIRT|nr:Isoaspartyl peptidase/L-asparaginase [Acipenser ruthenus]
MLIRTTQDPAEVAWRVSGDPAGGSLLGNALLVVCVQRVLLLPDPCTLDLSGVVIGVTSTDILFHMGAEEISSLGVATRRSVQMRGTPRVGVRGKGIKPNCSDAGLEVKRLRNWIAVMLPVIVVHGGAGWIGKERAEGSCRGVQEAVLAGYRILQRGGSALDAVEEAVVAMEDNPMYNAGCGSVLNELGGVEMDAIIMDGKTLASGAVSAVKGIANPIKLSRLVMEKTEHLCLTAEGASRFAKAMGVPEVEEESLKTDYSRKRWVENLAPGSNPVESQMGKMGTVGAVAIDSQGNVASATSTGGMLNKMVGRVGDTPCVGCGAYADNLFGAASPTGHGEAIMKVTLCRLILFHMEQGCGAYADNLFGAASPTGHGEAIMKVTLCRLILFHMEQGMSPEKAADTALDYMKTRVRGIGGVVVVNSSGDWAARFTSDQMAWAAVKNDQLHYGLYKGESFTLPVTNT